jgi:hypothetical protein
MRSKFELQFKILSIEFCSLTSKKYQKCHQICARVLKIQNLTFRRQNLYERYPKNSKFTNSESSIWSKKLPEPKLQLSSFYRDRTSASNGAGQMEFIFCSNHTFESISMEGTHKIPNFQNSGYEVFLDPKSLLNHFSKMPSDFFYTGVC